MHWNSVNENNNNNKTNNYEFEAGKYTRQRTMAQTTAENDHPDPRPVYPVSV